ncbi:DUF2167 domain-containing protein [Paenibacillus solani]|uniref:DUF2167 domain-containing protein n=1 Tax=Paenibacillus solani TaxID=1705565 RepID=UPI0006C8409E|nr:DUF2167 domain-containing protein [Paenibacillus solani]
MKRVLGLWLIFMLMLPTVVSASEDTLNFVDGGEGVTVKIGDVGTIDLGEGLYYLDKKDTEKVSLMDGNLLTGYEVASIGSTDENQNWFVYFDYIDSGHIKDAKDEKINADKLLKQIKKGNEEANKEKPESDHIFATGWDIEPFYDSKTHNLTWSLMLEDSEREPFLNYQVKLLTRHGYLSIILVTDSASREQAASVLSNEILANFTPTPGQAYGDYDSSTDKAASFGLTGLILGGAGVAAAKKVGLLLLLKKFWYIIAAGVVGVFSFIRNKLRGNKTTHTQDESETTPDQTIT